jgi:hypothetical protein
MIFAATIAGVRARAIPGWAFWILVVSGGMFIRGMAGGETPLRPPA